MTAFAVSAMSTAAVGVAHAQPNIALVKYWGKRDVRLNLPAAGSLSVTLKDLWTRTRVEFDAGFHHDALLLDGREDHPALRRVGACLDLLRAAAGTDCRARVETHNNFPTAAGLASSASGFAALVVATAAALDLDLEPAELSRLARQGSGSAARSIFGGFVEMHAGSRADGADAVAEPLASASDWPLEVVVAVTSRARKTTGSTDGMQHSADTSPFYPAWVASVDDDLAEARQAVARRDFEALADVSEASCLKMHAVMFSSRPALMYWSDRTLACIERVRQLRQRDGLGVFFTVDAGPQVKAVCQPADVATVAAALADLPGVERVLRTPLGEGARLVDAGSQETAGGGA